MTTSVTPFSIKQLARNPGHRTTAQENVPLNKQKPSIDIGGRLKPLAHSAANRCFGCGEANRTGLRLRFLVDDEGTVVCRVKIPARFEGPPGYVHGGVIATLLDEAMSKANRARGVIAMTRSLEVDYRRPVPLRTQIEIIGRHLRADGRKHLCEAEIRLNGAVLASGKALFIAIDAAKGSGPDA